MSKTFIVVLFVAFLALTLSPPAMSETTTSQTKALYSAYIDKLISKCKSKVGLRKSRLQNVRREAALSCFKAQFFNTYKEELIRDMIAENIGLKKHRIHYYLNKEFFRMFRSAIAAVPHLRRKAEVL